MKKCIFTIVAKNYIGLALVLEKSIKRYNEHLDFYIVIADNFDSNHAHVDLPKNCLIAKTFLPFSNEIWEEMSFKYNLTEFCTSIKPACFLEFFKDYEKVIYLDPDILFFDTPQIIFDLLDSYKAVLTPHVLYPYDRNASDTSERNWLQCGIFNFGFLALNGDSISVINVVKWWGDRLLDSCYVDNHDGTYTDQKWGDFFPSFFGNNELLIWRNLGANLAPWNFFEREVIVHDGVPFVYYRNIDKNVGDPSRLLFVHYSAYDYPALLKGLFIQKSILLPDYVDIKYILDEYAKFLSENSPIFSKYIKHSYSYNYFDNGEYIDDTYRRFYRASKEPSTIFSQPFQTSPNSFYYSLKKSKLLLAQGEVVGKLTARDIDNIENKVALINSFFKILFKIVGVKKYLLLVKYLRKFGRIESQAHLIKSTPK